MLTNPTNPSTNADFLAPTEREISDLLARANHETLDMLIHCAAVPTSSAAPLADLWAAQAANLRALLAQAALAVSTVKKRETQMTIYAVEPKVTVIHIDRTGCPSIDGFKIPDTAFGREKLKRIEYEISTGNPLYKLEDMR